MCIERSATFFDLLSDIFFYPSINFFALNMRRRDINFCRINFFLLSFFVLPSKKFVRLCETRDFSFNIIYNILRLLLLILFNSIKFKRADVPGGWAHLICALYTPGVSFGDVDHLTAVSWYVIFIHLFVRIRIRRAGRIFL